MIASEAQRKMFFALGHDLNVDASALKERAKTKFKLESFTQITSAQISELIESMQKKLSKTEHKHKFVCEKCKAHLELVIIEQE